MKAKRPTQSENALQRQVAWVIRLTAQPGLCWTHMPSGGHRRQAVAAKLKADGHQAGWPDLQFVFRGEVYFLELKTRKGTLSPSQRQVHAALLAQGARVDVARSLDEAIDVLTRWRLLRPSKRLSQIHQQPETTA